MSKTYIRQLPLPFKRDESFLIDFFEGVTGKKVALTLTDNSSSMLSFRTQGAFISVRLQRIFLDAGCEVINEIAQFINNRRVTIPLTREFARQKMADLKNTASEKIRIRSRGKCYDLKEIFDSLNNNYFNGRLVSRITWGLKNSRRAVKKRTLGSYDNYTDTIRISPVLDRTRVPSYFIAYIVYHEMLHADIGIEEKNGRRSMHSREFKRREKLYRDYMRAVAWEKKNL